MRRFYLFILLSFSLVARGQETANNLITRQKISVGLSYSFDYTSGKAVGVTYIGYPRNIEFKDFPILGFTYGLNFEIPLKKRIYFQSGLFYSKKGYRTEFESDYNNPSNTITFLSEKPVYYYLEIPFKVRIDLFTCKNNSRFFIAGGLGCNILRKLWVYREFYNSQTQQIQNGKFDLISSHRTYNLSLWIGLGADIKLTNNIYIRVNPEYVSFNRLNMYSRKIYSIGCNVGICYTL